MRTRSFWMPGLSLALAGCAASADVPAVLSQPVDSTVQQQVAQARARDLLTQFTTGKVKFNGPVTFQVGGTGNTASTTEATKAKAPVAAGPDAVATDASRKAGTLWQVYVAGAALMLGLGAVAGWRLRAI